MCHNATSRFSDVYFSIDLDSSPFTSFNQIFKARMYCVLMILSKLSLFVAEDWDSSNVQKTTLDLSTLLNRVATMTEALSARHDLRDDIKPWLQFTYKLRQVKVRFERLWQMRVVLLLLQCQICREMEITQTYRCPFSQVNSICLMRDSGWTWCKRMTNVLYEWLDLITENILFYMETWRSDTKLDIISVSVGLSQILGFEHEVQKMIPWISSKHRAVRHKLILKDSSFKW